MIRNEFVWNAYFIGKNVWRRKCKQSSVNMFTLVYSLIYSWSFFLQFLRFYWVVSNIDIHPFFLIRSITVRFNYSNLLKHSIRDALIVFSWYFEALQLNERMSDDVPYLIFNKEACDLLCDFGMVFSDVSWLPGILFALMWNEIFFLPIWYCWISY